MIFHLPGGREGDLVTPGSKGGLDTMPFFNKAEAKVTSAFYLVRLNSFLFPLRLGRRRYEWRGSLAWNPAGGIRFLS